MRLDKAILGWVEAHGEGLSESTIDEIRSIASGAVDAGVAYKPCADLAEDDRRAVITAAGNHTSLRAQAVDQFLGIAIAWGTEHRDDAHDPAGPSESQTAPTSRTVEAEPRSSKAKESEAKVANESAKVGSFEPVAAGGSAFAQALLSPEPDSIADQELVDDIDLGARWAEPLPPIVDDLSDRDDLSDFDGADDLAEIDDAVDLVDLDGAAGVDDLADRDGLADLDHLDDIADDLDDIVDEIDDVGDRGDEHVEPDDAVTAPAVNDSDLQTAAQSEHEVVEHEVVEHGTTFDKSSATEPVEVEASELEEPKVADTEAEFASTAGDALRAGDVGTNASGNDAASSFLETLDKNNKPSSFGTLARSGALESAPGSFGAASDMGVFSEAAQAPTVKKIDWITVALFGVAIICFCFAIYLYVSN